LYIIIIFEPFNERLNFKIKLHSLKELLNNFHFKKISIQNFLNNFFISEKHSIFTQKTKFIKVVTFAVLLFFAASANSKFADFCCLLKSAKNENPE
jgi:hypothetical protein